MDAREASKLPGCEPKMRCELKLARTRVIGEVLCIVGCAARRGIHRATDAEGEGVVAGGGASGRRVDGCRVCKGLV
jgi:hypothetical protein